MSRSDSRHVSWENAMTRNRSAHPRVRTPASPSWRSMMREKVFQGTNSITCANSVLPTFMRHSGLLKPASIANELNEIQIVDTHESSETRFNTGVAALQHQISRTLLSLGMFAVVSYRNACAVQHLKLQTSNGFHDESLHKIFHMAQFTPQNSTSRWTLDL